jgi:hypothetical protein
MLGILSRGHLGQICTHLCDGPVLDVLDTYFTVLSLVLVRCYTIDWVVGETVP